MADDGTDLGGVANGKGNAKSMSQPPEKKRRVLRRGDYTSAQMMRPHAPSPIEQTEINALWAIVNKGNDWVSYSSNVCDSDPERIGIGISQFAQCLKYAIAHYREPRVQACYCDAMKEKVTPIVNTLHPHLEVLDGGSMKKGFASLSADQKGRSIAEIKASAKYVYEWINTPNCHFRTYLVRMGAGGVVYQSQVEEKVMRAWLNTGVSQHSFEEAALARLSGTAKDHAAVADDTGDGW